MLALDLDGVFADFHKKFYEVCGFSYEVDPTAAWLKLEKEDNLFMQLELMPGAKELYNTIKANTTRKIIFLTALPRLTGKLVTASADKTQWVHTHLDPEAQVICVPGWREKRNYARPGYVLVDDMERNINHWEEAGGIGVQHKNNDDTLAMLLDLQVLRGV